MSAPKGFNLYTALEKTYPAREFALFYEVRNSTGYGPVSRSADAIAMSLWPSRGLELIGIEIKRARNDWLREKADPQKSHEIQRFCDRWFVAVDDESIVQDGELPPTWGLLVPHGKTPNRLRVKVAAPKLEPEALSRGFIASLLRQAAASNAKAVAARLEAMKGEKAETDTTNADYRLQSAERQLKETQEKLAALHRDLNDFERASGVKLGISSSWSRPLHTNQQIGAAVRAVLEGNTSSYITEIERCRNSLVRMEHELGQQLAQLRHQPSQSSAGGGI